MTEKSEGSLKQRVERSLGENFIQWYNKDRNSNFSFNRLGNDPPDLVYSDGKRFLPIEITTSYYDSKYATMRWENARNSPTAPDSWSGDNPDQSLVANINQQLVDKCVSMHDSGTILLIGIYPALTTNLEFEELKKGITMPQSVPFSEVYIGGEFPLRGTIPGGYFYFRLR